MGKISAAVITAEICNPETFDKWKRVRPLGWSGPRRLLVSREELHDHGLEGASYMTRDHSARRKLFDYYLQRESGTKIS